MGLYAVHKESLLKVQQDLERLKNSIPSRKNGGIFDYLIKRQGILASKIKSYGSGWVHSIVTPKGKFYLVNVDDEDIPDLLADMGVESYVATKINSHIMLK